LIEKIDSIIKNIVDKFEEVIDSLYTIRVALTEEYDIEIPTSVVNYLSYFRRTHSSHPDSYYDHMDVNFSMMVKDDGTSIHKNPRCFFFRAIDEPDRIKSIINSIETAKKQLSGTKASIIFVDHKVVNQYSYETDMTRIRPLILDLLKNNTSISCVCLTSTIINRSDIGTSYNHHGKTIINENARYQIPIEMKWIVNAF
jgi:hypothetical protein